MPEEFPNSHNPYSPRTYRDYSRGIVAPRRHVADKRGLIDNALPHTSQFSQVPPARPPLWRLFRWKPRHIVGLATAAILLWFAITSQSNAPPPPTANASPAYAQGETKPEEVKPGLPLRLRIPKINVDAGIEQMGLTPDSEMDTPTGAASAGWFKLGPRPGEIGSAVIDGHFGWTGGKAAVFDNLHTLQKGDKFSVVDEKGASIGFEVRELRTYGPNEDASAVFRSSDKKAHLNLITCTGAWNKAQKSYSSRLVVFADGEPL